MSMSDQLEQLVNSIRSSAKYKNLPTELTSSIGAQELERRRNLKEAVKATKNRLHQLAGAYQLGKMDYSGWLWNLQQANGELAALRKICREILLHHASTRERLPMLDEFYPALFAGLPPFTSILDLACGLNPFTIPWMALPAGITYFACDIYADQVNFLNQSLPLLGVHGVAQVCDLLTACPPQTVDVAFLFKTLPCLEQADKAIGRKLLETINAPVLFVSFPAQSLGGHNKGMAVNYEQHFQALVVDKPWRIERFVFKTELVFRIFR
ncbi:MAG: hypothetical protein U0350_40955 [Caldilineaceae bacterium]